MPRQVILQIYTELFLRYINMVFVSIIMAESFIFQGLGLQPVLFLKVEEGNATYLLPFCHTNPICLTPSRPALVPNPVG